MAGTSPVYALASRGNPYTVPAINLHLTKHTNTQREARFGLKGLIFQKICAVCGTGSTAATIDDVLMIYILKTRNIRNIVEAERLNW